MNHIKTAGLLLGLLLVISGCGGPHYYDLYIKPAPIKSTDKIDKILMVEDLWTSQDLWRQNMVIRRSSYKVQYYPYKQWAKSPGEMIKDTIIRYFKNSQFFRRVVDDQSLVEADMLMRIRVGTLEMLYKESVWFAHLALDCELIDPKTEKTILFHSFDRTKQIEGKIPKYLPAKISNILEEELLEIIEKIKNLSKF